MNRFEPGDIYRCCMTSQLFVVTKRLNVDSCDILWLNNVYNSILLSNLAYGLNNPNSDWHQDEFIGNSRLHRLLLGFADET